MHWRTLLAVPPACVQSAPLSLPPTYLLAPARARLKDCCSVSAGGVPSAPLQATPTDRQPSPGRATPESSRRRAREKPSLNLAWNQGQQPVQIIPAMMATNPMNIPRLISAYRTIIRDFETENQIRDPGLARPPLLVRLVRLFLRAEALPHLLNPRQPFGIDLRRRGRRRSRRGPPHAGRVEHEAGIIVCVSAACGLFRRRC